VQKLYGN